MAEEKKIPTPAPEAAPLRRPEVDAAPILPVRYAPARQKIFLHPSRPIKNALRILTQCVLTLGQPYSSSCLGTLWVMCSKSRTRWFSSLSNT